MRFPIFLTVVFCLPANAPAEDDGPTTETYNKTFFVSEIFQKYGNREYMTYEGFEHLLENLGLGRLKFDVSHDVSMHKINGTFKEFHDELKLHKHDHQFRRRNIVKRNLGEYKRDRKRCLTPQELLASYGLEATHGVIISQKGFLDMCPAIVYELDRKSCGTDAEYKAPDGVGYHLVWLYASMSILLMSVAGVLSILLVPVVTRGCYKRLLEFSIATGVGTLCGDALLHLLPHVLVHRADQESKSQPILRGTFALISIFLFYVIESLLKLIQNRKTLKSTVSDELGKIMTVEEENRSKIDDARYHSHGSHHQNDAFASMVIIGDILHNVTDGLSIGAAFASSISSGFASSIAIFAHELPHELGDSAALIRSGMSKKKTILYNIVSSIFSFFGMVIGILLGELQHASLWINAFTAGSFLYISLSDLVPEMKICPAGESRVKNLSIRISGLICGGFIMLCVALFEDDLETLIK